MLRILAVALLVVGLINLAPAVTTFIVGSEEVEQTTPEALEDEGLANAVVKDVGGPTTTIGIPVYFVAILSIITAGFLLANHANWIMMAVGLLSTDIVLKVIGIISQVSVGAGLLDITPTIMFGIVEAVLIVLFMQYRQNHEEVRRADPTSPEGVA